MKKIIIIGIVVLLVGGAGVFAFIKLYSGNDEDILITANDSIEAFVPVNLEFELPVDSFNIIRGSIKRNQNIGAIFHEFDISDKTIEMLVQASKDVFDLTKVRYGRPYHMFCTKDTLNIPKYFIYEHSQLEYFMVDFTDSVEVFKKLKATDTITRASHGTIEESLWKTMKKNDINPLMANELSEIYAWSINFFGLQKGDSFKVIYDEVFVDSASIGFGKIHAAFFHHDEEDFYAIPFVQDSILSFFNDSGQSLRKEFLKAPLKYSRVSSGYSGHRYHPILHTYTTHYGVDYAAGYGTPVLAIADGKITVASYDRYNGNYIKMTHNSVYKTAYLHLSGFAPGIVPGKKVMQGDVIGYVGSTGLSTGPHLDFRLYKNGYAINPLTFEAPPVEPVKEENMKRFDSVKAVVMKRLREE